MCHNVPSLVILNIRKEHKHTVQTQIRLLHLIRVCTISYSASLKQIQKEILSSRVYPITLHGRWGTTDEWATIPFNLVLSSVAPVELANSAHSFILSSHLYFCLPFLVFHSPCSAELSLPHLKTLRHGQTTLAFVSSPYLGVYRILQ